MDILNQINEFLTRQLGEFGPIIVVGVLGLFMILMAIPLMLKQPEDPLKKFKRDINQKTKSAPQKEKLRQGGRNEQLQKLQHFWNPRMPTNCRRWNSSCVRLGINQRIRFGSFTLPSLRWASPG